MNKIFQFHVKQFGWISSSGTTKNRLLVNGQVYWNGRFVSSDELLNQLEDKFKSTSLVEFLSELNGFYSWIYQDENEIRAAVDHVRSKPLFYALDKDIFFISDDAEWVRNKVNDKEKDPDACQEFKSAGYVTGRDTLYTKVKQIQAGEAVSVKADNENLSFNSYRYYRFLHKEPGSYNKSQLGSELYDVLVESFRRLLEYASGRQVVVPLSSGYDSRLIVLMLKRMSYHNVLTFSYGVPGNKESICSSMIAASLGFDWVFIEYSNKKWAQAWATDEAREFLKMASNHSSLPNIQDWLAVYEMYKTNKLDESAVFVPGHTGDFVSGGHIPACVFDQKIFGISDLINELKQNHLSNGPIIDNNWVLDNHQSSRLLDRIGQEYEGTDVSFANLYELWDWQERQAKYIVNCVRVYDQFKYNWWLPLWDMEFVKFWQNVPLHLRKERLWFIAWINEAFEETTGIDESAIQAWTDTRKIYRKLGALIIERLPSVISDKVRSAVLLNKPKNICKDFINHPLAFGGLVHKKNLCEYFENGYNIIGIYSELFINDEWRDIDGW